MPSLYLSTARRPGTLHIAVIGPLTRQTAATFTERMSALVHLCDPDTRSLVVDLRCCTALDAEGAGALAALRAAVEDLGGALLLERVPPLIEPVVLDIEQRDAGSDGQAQVRTSLA
jgi:anti-anti-sigma regulatory factor